MNNDAGSHDGGMGGPGAELEARGQPQTLFAVDSASAAKLGSNFFFLYCGVRTGVPFSFGTEVGPRDLLSSWV